MIPVLYAVSKLKITAMPAITSNPKKTSVILIGRRNNNGSKNAVKKPTAAKQTSATDTFAYLIEP